MKDIFKMIKKDLSMDMMIRLTENNFIDFFNLTTKEFKTYKELKILFENYDLDINKVYFTLDHFFPVWYIDSPVYYNLQHLMCLEEMSLKQMNSYKNHLNKYVIENDWESLIFTMNDVFALDYFINHYKEMPKNQACKILCNLYTSREYVLDKLNIDIIKECLNGYNVSKIPSDKISEDGFINIYRGQTYASTPLQRALSWSLDINTADWFANRFDSNGEVYMGKARLSDIMFYTNDREEEEILIEFKNIKDVEVI